MLTFEEGMTRIILDSSQGSESNLHNHQHHHRHPPRHQRRAWHHGTILAGLTDTSGQVLSFHQQAAPLDLLDQHHQQQLMEHSHGHGDLYEQLQKHNSRSSNKLKSMGAGRRSERGTGNRNKVHMESRVVSRDLVVTQQVHNRPNKMPTMEFKEEMDIVTDQSVHRHNSNLHSSLENKESGGLDHGTRTRSKRDEDGYSHKKSHHRRPKVEKDTVNDEKRKPYPVLRTLAHIGRQPTTEDLHLMDLGSSYRIMSAKQNQKHQQEVSGSGYVNLPPLTRTRSPPSPCTTLSRGRRKRRRVEFQVDNSPKYMDNRKSIAPVISIEVNPPSKVVPLKPILKNRDSGSVINPDYVCYSERGSSASSSYETLRLPSLSRTSSVTSSNSLAVPQSVSPSRVYRSAIRFTCSKEFAAVLHTMEDDT